MTEAEWLACTNPQDMLPRNASARKSRLFACACCRRIWSLLLDSRARDAVEIAERFADGLVGELERSEARKEAQQVAQSRAVVAIPVSPKWERRAASAVYYATARVAGEAFGAWGLAVEALVWQAGGYGLCDSEAISRSERTQQSAMLRDIFGNPFRPVARQSVCMTQTVTMLAQGIYESRDFSVMPILADALEDAGCDNPDILSHCRGPGPHVRGCWVIDLLLGKE
jgi:hypothetical protein